MFAFSACFCAQVDAINFYMEEEAGLMRLCNEERETAYRDPIGIAFITLQSDMQAQRSVVELVCVREKGRERERMCVCVWVWVWVQRSVVELVCVREKGRERENVCVCVCVSLI